MKDDRIGKLIERDLRKPLMNIVEEALTIQTLRVQRYYRRKILRFSLIFLVLFNLLMTYLVLRLMHIDLLNNTVKFLKYIGVGIIGLGAIAAAINAIIDLGEKGYRRLFGASKRSRR